MKAFLAACAAAVFSAFGLGFLAGRSFRPRARVARPPRPRGGISKDAVLGRLALVDQAPPQPNPPSSSGASLPPVSPRGPAGPQATGSE